MKNLLLVVILLSNTFLFSQSIKEFALGEVPEGIFEASSNVSKAKLSTFGGVKGALIANILKDGRSYQVMFSSMKFISSLEFLTLKDAIEDHYNIKFNRVYYNETYKYQYEVDKDEQKYALSAEETLYDDKKFSFIFHITDIPLLKIKFKEDE
jgi:hypothetical protein